jgi:hypothetical protein
MPLKSAQPRGVEPTRAAPPACPPSCRAGRTERMPAARHPRRRRRRLRRCGVSRAAGASTRARSQPPTRCPRPQPTPRALHGSPAMLRPLPAVRGGDGASNRRTRLPDAAAFDAESASPAAGCAMRTQRPSAAPDTAQRARTRGRPAESLFAAPGSSPRTLPASPALALMPQPALPRLFRQQRMAGLRCWPRQAWALTLRAMQGARQAPAAVRAGRSHAATRASIASDGDERRSLRPRLADRRLQQPLLRCTDGSSARSPLQSVVPEQRMPGVLRVTRREA